MGKIREKYEHIFKKIIIIAHILLIFCTLTAFYSKITENMYYMSNFAAET